MAMGVEIGAEIRVKDPPEALREWCEKELVIANPEYAKKERMGFWLGNTPRTLSLYRTDGGDLILPTGVGGKLREYLPQNAIISVQTADNGLLDYQGNVPLYEYQEAAVNTLSAASCGILQSPCGSGKTQMGIALAARLSRKTLWVTHTQDLLAQSYERAAQYFPESTFGKITAGKVAIGSHLTFATVQTLSKIDLAKFRYVWDVLIVDECHRLAGSPTQVSMFYKVASNLAARRKYGLSATVHRADGMIKSTFAILGPIVYSVPDEAVRDKTMQVRILRRDTGTEATDDCYDTDGTLDYMGMLGSLCEDPERNRLIVADLVSNREHSNLILSDRISHLETLRDLLPEELRDKAAMINGKMTSKTARAERQQAIEDMRAGRKKFLFATYSLAKEGLDIPCLDRLYMTTPKKDYAVVTQSIGRIARTCAGKTDAVCYDYVDSIAFCEGIWKKRKASYRKAGCEF